MSKLTSLQAMTETHVYLMIFSLCLILCHCGSHHVSSSCEVQVLVRRGTVYRTSPREHVVVKCPVQHCGETVHIVWCKLLDTDDCKELNNSKNIQKNQTMQLDGKLESILTFKRISVEDAGLYTCRDEKLRSVGHIINVTVSDQPPNNVPNQQIEITSLAYFVIFLSVVLVLFIITVIVLLRMYGCKRTLKYNPKTQEKPSTHMIPELPKTSPPALHQSVSMVNDIYNSGTASSSHSEMTTRSQFVAHTSEHQLSRYATYSQINRKKSQNSTVQCTIQT